MSIIDFKKYLHGRSGVDPRQVEIELNQKKITDINVRLGRVKSYLDAFQNLERRKRDSLKDRKLFPEQLFTGEIREMVGLIKGLSDALSSDSYDILQNKFSDFLQSHETLKFHLIEYRKAADDKTKTNEDIQAMLNIFIDW